MLSEAPLDDIEIPANLRINDQIQRIRKACRRMGCARPFHHFAFGQSPFGPPPGVVEALRENADKHSYLPTAGLPELREAVAAYYQHHFAAPLQYAALKGYSLDEDVEAHVRDCAAVNAIVGVEVADLMRGIGTETRAPGGAFYVLADWSRERENLSSVGLTSSPEVARHVLHVEHAAMLPGTALLVDEETIAFRCSYVDYDGTQALEDWRKQPPSSASERREFVRRNCPLLTDGVSHLGRYLEQVRAGRKPEHL